MDGDSARGDPNGDEAVGPEDRDFGDPTRRTYFAEERTLLAWWRSGLGALAVSLGVGRIAPSITHASRGPYVALGLGYAIAGIVFVFYGSWRQRAQERALALGRFRALDRPLVLAMTGWLAMLAIATLLLVLLG